MTKKSGSEDDRLLQLIAEGNLEKVRGYFDSVFWESREERPGWHHVRLALKRGDLPVLRLLYAWGASPSEGDMKALAAAGPAEYPAYLQLLRTAGFRAQAESGEKYRPEGNAGSRVREEGGTSEDFFNAAALPAGTLPTRPPHPFDPQEMQRRVPQEWLDVLKCFQAEGAQEAIIQGGALRDLFNQKPIKDVDIFLRSRGNSVINYQFIKQAFASTGLKISEMKSPFGTDSAGAMAVWWTASCVTPYPGETGMPLQGWTVRAGGSNTEYNIIFVEPYFDARLKDSAGKKYQAAAFADCMQDSCDLALCQICCNGKGVWTSQAYRDDVDNRRLTLLQPTMSTKTHLVRVAEKYADWQPDAVAQQFLDSLAKPKSKQLTAPSPSRRRGFWFTLWY